MPNFKFNVGDRVRVVNTEVNGRSYGMFHVDEVFIIGSRRDDLGYNGYKLDGLLHNNYDEDCFEIAEPAVERQSVVLWTIVYKNGENIRSSGFPTQQGAEEQKSVLQRHPHQFTVLALKKITVRI